MSTYDNLKAAAPADTQKLLEVIGHVAASHRAELVAICRRIGCPVSEFDSVVHQYRLRMEKGLHPPHQELF